MTYALNLFVTQRAEDKSVRSSIRQATDGRCEAQSTLRRNPLQRLRVRLLGLLLAADKMSCGMPAAYSILRRICHVVEDSETWPSRGFREGSRKPRIERADNPTLRALPDYFRFARDSGVIRITSHKLTSRD
jgi:hypothetical protein